MPILINDKYLEQQINTERERRGDATQSKTATSLIRERLAQIECELRRGGCHAEQPGTNDHAA